MASFSVIGRFLPLTFSLFSSVSAQSVRATPTDVMSLGSSGCSINGKETVQANQKQDLVQSPAPPQGPTLVAGFGACDASLTLLECQQLADELRQVVRRAVGFHQQVNFLSDASSSCLTLMSR